MRCAVLETFISSSFFPKCHNLPSRKWSWHNDLGWLSNKTWLINVCYKLIPALFYCAYDRLSNLSIRCLSFGMPPFHRTNFGWTQATPAFDPINLIHLTFTKRSSFKSSLICSIKTEYRNLNLFKVAKSIVILQLSTKRSWFFKIKFSTLKFCFIEVFLCYRLLSYSHVFSRNMWLMANPDILSYDWQMGSVPLVHSLYDSRNISSFVGLIFSAAAFVSILHEVKLNFMFI